MIRRELHADPLFLVAGSERNLLAGKLLPATARQDGNSRTERQRNCYEFWAIFTVPRQCGIENPSYGDTHERRSHVWTVIDVLVQHPALTGGSTTSAH